MIQAPADGLRKSSDQMNIGEISTAILEPILAPLHFRLVSARLDHARWKSSSVTIDITFDRTRSYELDIALTRHRGWIDRFEPFSLWQVLRFKGAQPPQDFSSVQVSNAEAAGIILARMAQSLVGKGPEFLRGNRPAFAALRRWCARNDEAYTRGFALSAAREAARSAWERRDYLAVVGALRPYRAHLTQAEAKRMEIAAKRSRPTQR